MKVVSVSGNGSDPSHNKTVSFLSAFIAWLSIRDRLKSFPVSHGSREGGRLKSTFQKVVTAGRPSRASRNERIRKANRFAGLEFMASDYSGSIDFLCFTKLRATC